MAREDPTNLHLPTPAVATGPLAEDIHSIDTDPEHPAAQFADKWQESFELPTIYFPSQPYTPPIYKHSVSWDTLARMNALINHSTCRFFVRDERIWKRALQFNASERFMQVTVAEINDAHKTITTIPVLVFYIGDAMVETCARVNAFLRYGKCLCIAEMNDEQYKVEAVRPLNFGWIELIIAEADDNVHIVRKYYEPLWLLV